ncbi:hypothetical protein AUC70_01515 [Methyloceanibacter stevinii]|uniref:Uncharacterized protein n=1 Tax=Methyloceanibacter stevinii TaxID=1774970 RepID=A0A1E3VQ05_9HYPH|nr:hypothetical protein [Methyloceanibacter stevinii]ODR95603.1 hypothetical protein AUC70_01515 [Methyloceanibacter stevinii]
MKPWSPTMKPLPSPLERLTAAAYPPRDDADVGRAAIGLRGCHARGDLPGESTGRQLRGELIAMGAAHLVGRDHGRAQRARIDLLPQRGMGLEIGQAVGDERAARARRRIERDGTAAEAPQERIAHAHLVAFEVVHGEMPAEALGLGGDGMADIAIDEKACAVLGEPGERFAEPFVAEGIPAFEERAAGGEDRPRRRTFLQVGATTVNR